MRNDLGELSAFATVAEERSFTRAAARLGISQSALSHSMREEVEKRLGVPVARSDGLPRSVSATAAELLCCERSRLRWSRIERAVAEAAQAAGDAVRTYTHHHPENGDKDSALAETGAFCARLPGGRARSDVF